MPISENSESKTGKKLTNTKVSACIQSETSSNGNTLLMNTEMAIQKSIKVTQAMRIFLTSLRDDLKANPLPQDSLGGVEHTRKGRDVTDKLEHAYHGFKISITDVLRSVQVKKMKLSPNTDSNHTIHRPLIKPSSTEVTACEVIELSEESDADEQP